MMALLEAKDSKDSGAEDQKGSSECFTKRVEQ